MRLGQLARKYNIQQDKVILFLNEVQTELSPFHHNSKLNSDMEDLVIDHFSLAPEAEEEVIEDIPTEADEQKFDDIEIDDGIKTEKKTEADLQRELDPTLPAIKSPAIKIKDENSIETDRLLELAETDESLNDLSKITHIKAPKKELSGLKVVGKIELAIPKSKSADKTEEKEKEDTSERNKKLEAQRKREEERDIRRLKEIEKKEQYETRQEKRKIEGEKKKRKAQNKVRYEEKMQKVKGEQVKQKAQKEEVAPEVNEQPQTYKPISIFDKFWKLFGL